MLLSKLDQIWIFHKIMSLSHLQPLFISLKGEKNTQIQLVGEPTNQQLLNILLSSLPPPRKAPLLRNMGLNILVVYPYSWVFPMKVSLIVHLIRKKKVISDTRSSLNIKEYLRRMAYLQFSSQSILN